MNENEMIKEVANLIYSCQFADDCTGGHCDECLATALINLGYRKISDDEIVITKRQYEQLKKHNRDRKRLRLRWQQAKQELEQAKQETTREVLQKVKDILQGDYNIPLPLAQLYQENGIYYGGKI